MMEFTESVSGRSLLKKTSEWCVERRKPKECRKKKKGFDRRKARKKANTEGIE